MQDIASIYDRELKNSAALSPYDLQNQYTRENQYPTWDPTTAKYWNLFESSRDHKLIPAETKILEENLCVVYGSPSASRGSYGRAFLQLYSADLPIFIAADPILHAWHHSFDNMLEEVETYMLSPTLENLLTDMLSFVPDFQKLAATQSPLVQKCVADAEIFLCVALSLLTGCVQEPVTTSRLSVQKLVDAISHHSGIQSLELFGSRREEDCSMYKPRGHYNKNTHLQRYFMSMMWCGRQDMRCEKGQEVSSAQQMCCASILHLLLAQKKGNTEIWESFNKLLDLYIGIPDSATFTQLSQFLKEENIRSISDITEDSLHRVVEKILGSTIGVQRIAGHVHVLPQTSNASGLSAALPRSFTFLGQRFAIDSWALGSLVDLYDRRRPSAVDIGFSVLGNKAASEVLAQRMTQGKAPFRDGVNIAPKLAAIYNAVNTIEDKEWDNSIYTMWLKTLRALSEVPEDTETETYPEYLRSNASGLIDLNSQLASWAELRHDTILYVKQSFTCVPCCEYPNGYVDPRVHFWQRFEDMVGKTVDLLMQAPFSDNKIEVSPWQSIKPSKLRDMHVQFLKVFQTTLRTLKEIAQSELVQKPLTIEQLDFIKSAVIESRKRAGSGSVASYSGWFCNLHYREPVSCMKQDSPIVADVHTDLPSREVGDPGSIIHVGTGPVKLMMVAVDNGGDKMVFCGPVASFYEFDMPTGQRKTDEEWRADIRQNKLPALPEWTSAFSADK